MSVFFAKNQCSLAKIVPLLKAIIIGLVIIVKVIRVKVKAIVIRVKVTLLIYGSNRSQMLFKTSVLKKLRNIYRKTPVLESFLIKFQAFRPVTLLKRDCKTDCL